MDFYSLWFPSQVALAVKPYGTRYDGRENGEKEEEPGQAENPEISRV
jgi:hypothetical protein